MSSRLPRLVALLPLALVPGLALMAAGAACELVVNLDPALVDAGPMTDVLDCGICADVSADASYDGDVSIFGVQSRDAGSERGTADPAARD